MIIEKDLERARNGETTLKLMDIFGLKIGDLVQSIKICFDVDHQHPYVEIVRLVDSEKLEQVYNLVNDTKKMVDVPVAEPTHEYKFKVKETIEGKE